MKNVFLLISFLSFGSIAFGKPKHTYPTGEKPFIATVMFSVNEAVSKGVATKGTLGFTKSGRAIEAYYFPGVSANRALIIGGVHGSELSSVEVARRLITKLQAGEKPFYSLVVLPCLFPDNAANAASEEEEIGGVKNIGRYSDTEAVDPNRQMPALGKAFSFEAPFDNLGRPIEAENQLLLYVIQAFKPQRIVNIHAIRDVQQAGIFADPRTDAGGVALGYNSDSLLAVKMVDYVYQHGGIAPGNNYNSKVTTKYYCDPPIARAGEPQPRNIKGSQLPNNRGAGISLGSWASTAVNDSANAEFNRDAIRILTMEFPGYKRPTDYTTPAQQRAYANLVDIYAGAIREVFLQKVSVEEPQMSNSIAAN